MSNAHRLLLTVESLEASARALRVQANTLEHEANVLRGRMLDGLTEPTPAKHCRKWTEADDKALLGQAYGEMAQEGGLRGDRLAIELGRLFDRSAIAIAARLVKLGAWS